MAKTRRKARREPDGLENHAPLRHQQAHKVEPTEPVVVTIRKAQVTVNGRTSFVDQEMVQTVRRQADARIWERFDTEQEAAAMQVFGAWRAITVGVGMRTFDPDRVSGGGDAASAVEFNVALRETWRRWVALCDDREIQWRACADILCLGLSTRLLDHTHKRRNGWALDEVCRALDVWCYLRQWKQEPKERVA